LFQETPQHTPGESTPEPSEHEHTPELIKTKEGIVLSPQPHEDPNDPLVPPSPHPSLARKTIYLW